MRRKPEHGMVLLSKVAGAFPIPGRGCVVVPLALANPELRVRSGDAVQIRVANSCFDAHITTVEWLVRRGNGRRLGLLLSATIDCSRIGPDAEIWIEQSS